MKRKGTFLLVCTLAYPIVFFACGGVFWCLLFLLPEAARQVGAELYLRVMLPLIPLLERVDIRTPSLSVDVLFFLSNGYLWGLCLWHARAAWRRLRNLPPVAHLS